MQTNFDWTRAEQLGFVERWQPPRRPGVSVAACKAVLRAIDGFGRGREAWPSEATLAVTAGVSVRTVKRVVRALVDMSVVIVERRGPTTVNHYRIVWTELALLMPERSAMVSERSAMVSERSAMVSPTKCHHGPLNDKKQQETTTTESGVVVVVRSCGVVKAAEAVASARARGLSDAAIETLCEAWRRLPAAERGAAKLFNWLAIEGSYSHPEVLPSNLRGDAMTRSETEREQLRFRIVRRGRAAGADESEISRRLQLAGCD